MLEVLGKEYYIDVDKFIEKCRPDYIQRVQMKSDKDEDEDGSENILDNNEDGSENNPITYELNVFKFEIYKSCFERVLSEYLDDDGDLDIFANKKLSPSFKLAYNTLLKNEIITEGDDE